MRMSEMDRAKSLKVPMVLAWVNVGLYVIAGVFFANNYGWERSLRIYTGFDLISKGWYEDVLIRPGMFWVSLTVAVLLTKRVKRGL